MEGTEMKRRRKGKRERDWGRILPYKSDPQRNKNTEGLFFSFLNKFRDHPLILLSLKMRNLNVDIKIDWWLKFHPRIEAQWHKHGAFDHSQFAIIIILFITHILMARRRKPTWTLLRCQIRGRNKKNFVPHLYSERQQKLETWLSESEAFKVQGSHTSSLYTGVDCNFPEQRCV